MTSPLYTHPGIDADGVLAALAKDGFEIGPESSVRRTLLDTFDGRLNAAGLRLEFQEASGHELVLTGGGPASAHIPVSSPPRFGSDLPVGPLRARLAPLLDVRALRPVVSLDTRQRSAVRRDKLGKAVASVLLHDHLSLSNEVIDEHGGRPSWAAEVNELVGYPKAAERARALLGSLGLQELDSDLMTFAAADTSVDLGGHSGSPTVALDRREPAFEAFRRVLANLADEIDANYEGTLGKVDPEFLHDFRVAVRRTRSVLAQGKGVLPTRLRGHFREEFGWLGAATGPARDLDVYLIEWDSYVAPLEPDVAAALKPLFEHVDHQRLNEHVALAMLLRSSRYLDLMGAWSDWLAAPAGEQHLGVDAPAPIGKVAARRIGVANDRLVARGRKIGPDTPAEELHELRKDAKKLRYLLECFGAVLPSGERKAFVQRLKALQDNLGEHQDTEVHAAQLRAMSHELIDHGAGAETLVAMGQLAGEFERRRVAARSEFAERFAAYDTAKTRRTLGALLHSAAVTAS